MAATLYTVHCYFVYGFETYFFILHKPASYFMDTYLLINRNLHLSFKTIAVKNISNDYRS